MKLSIRLNEIASLVPRCVRVIDVGTDHAQLPLALLHIERVQRAIGVDKSALPLAQARVNRMNAGCKDLLDLRCADGLQGLNPEPDDVVVMAGMGAHTMVQILEESDWRGTLVLQPNRDVPQLRRWLCNNGWSLDIETLIKSNGQWFWTSRWFHGMGVDLPEDAIDFGVHCMTHSAMQYRLWMADEVERLGDLPERAVSRMNLPELNRIVEQLKTNHNITTFTTKSDMT